MHVRRTPEPLHSAFSRNIFFTSSFTQGRARPGDAVGFALSVVAALASFGGGQVCGCPLAVVMLPLALSGVVVVTLALLLVEVVVRAPCLVVMIALAPFGGGRGRPCAVRWWCWFVEMMVALPSFVCGGGGSCLFVGGDACSCQTMFILVTSKNVLGYFQIRSS